MTTNASDCAPDDPVALAQEAIDDPSDSTKQRTWRAAVREKHLAENYLRKHKEVEKLKLALAETVTLAEKITNGMSFDEAYEHELRLDELRAMADGRTPPNVDVKLAIKHALQAMRTDQYWLNKHPPIETIARAVLFLVNEHERARPVIEAAINWRKVSFSATALAKAIDKYTGAK